MPTLPVPQVPAPLGPARAVPDWLRSTLDAVLADLQQPTALALAVGWTDGDGDRPGTLWLQEVDCAPSLTGVDIGPGAEPDLLVEVAARLQDQFFWETAGAWGEARPACPGHGHPAEPRVEGSAACWVCPATGAELHRIGALAS